MAVSQAEIQRREELVVIVAQHDVLPLDLLPRLLKVGPQRHAVPPAILHVERLRHGQQLVRRLQRGGGPRTEVVADEVLEVVDLNFEIAPRREQVRAPRGHLRLRLLLVQRSQRADLDAPLVVGGELLGEFERGRLHPHVVAGEDQFVIRLLHAGHGGHHLIAECQLVNLERAFVHQNRLARGVNPRVLQQRLRETEARVGRVVVAREGRTAAADKVAIERDATAGAELLREAGPVTFGETVAAPVEQRAVGIGRAGRSVEAVRGVQVERQVVVAARRVEVVEVDARLEAADLDVEILVERQRDALRQRHDARRGRGSLCVDGQRKRQRGQAGKKSGSHMAGRLRKRPHGVKQGSL